MKRKWYPRRGRYRRFVCLSTSAPARVLREWLAFLRKNPGRHRRKSLSDYIQQQLRDGMDPSTINNRLKTLRRFGVPLDEESAEQALDRIYINLCIKRLRALKNNIGTRFKRFYSLSYLRTVYAEDLGPAAHPWQLVWYLLVVSGARLANLIGSEFYLEPEGIRIFYLQGRKTDLTGLRCGILYLYVWSEPPPDYLRYVMRGRFRIEGLGSKLQAASRLNRWLQTSESPLTSGLPRTRMDNILRGLIDLGWLTESEYVRVMDHSLNTSDKHYYDS